MPVTIKYSAGPVLFGMALDLNLESAMEKQLTARRVDLAVPWVQRVAARRSTVSLQHLPSSLSYKSQRPLLFQTLQREGRERGGVVLTDVDSYSAFTPKAV